MIRYHWTPAQIARLTERQIVELALHPRDEKTGAAKAPAERSPEATRRLRALRFLAAAGKMRMPKDQIARRLAAMMGGPDGVGRDG